MCSYCQIEDDRKIQLPGDLWEYLGNPNSVTVDVEDGMPQYLSIKILRCADSSGIPVENGSIVLDDDFLEEHKLFAGMRFIPVLSGNVRLVFLNLVHPYCERCGGIEHLFDCSRSGHVVYFCKNCIKEIAGFVKE
ncbi:MAG: hypothetical protein ACOX6U_10470 [Oscillospiraceae bacterium]|jgi:hypothetical protein